VLQLLYEDNETNRMHESLNLFASIVNNIHFTSMPFIVFFNKYDLFEVKLEKSRLEDVFPEYKGDNR
jgi:50S ribosomal subunit-associated GTPase HflX